MAGAMPVIVLLFVFEERMEKAGPGGGKAPVVTEVESRRLCVDFKKLSQKSDSPGRCESARQRNAELRPMHRAGYILKLVL